MKQEWDIKARSTDCTACGTGFGDAQPYYSALCLGEAGYERGDFCAGCWEAQASKLTPFSSWQGLFRLPPAAPEEPLKRETAESLLRKLIEDNDPQHESVIFILAVMLERKKTLSEKDVTVDEDGAMHRIYEHRQTGETFLIPDPQLKLDQLEDVQMRVIAMLGGTNPDESKSPDVNAEEPDQEKNGDENTDP